MPLDKTQLTAFIDALVGVTPIGVDADHNEVTVPTSPLAHAFITARLGDLVPRGGWDIVGKPATRSPERAQAFAGLLREVAAGIAPETCSTPSSPGTDALRTLIGAVEDFIGCYNADIATHTGHLDGATRTLAEMVYAAAAGAVMTLYTAIIEWQTEDDRRECVARGISLLFHDEPDADIALASVFRWFKNRRECIPDHWTYLCAVKLYDTQPQRIDATGRLSQNHGFHCVEWKCDWPGSVQP